MPYEQIIKGYEIAPDQYVVLSPDELDQLDPVKTRTIDIEDFVDLADIDPIYFDHPYYLAPGTGAEKAYRLLLEAMAEAGKVAIAQGRDPLQGAARRDPAVRRHPRDGDHELRRRDRRPRRRSTICPTNR